MTHKVYRAVDPELTAEGRRHLQKIISPSPASDGWFDLMWQRLVELQGATLAKGDEVRFADGKIEVTT